MTGVGIRFRRKKNSEPPSLARKRTSLHLDMSICIITFVLGNKNHSPMLAERQRQYQLL
jgi:hypothetical protein